MKTSSQQQQDMQPSPTPPPQQQSLPRSQSFEIQATATVLLSPLLNAPSIASTLTPPPSPLKPEQDDKYKLQKIKKQAAFLSEEQWEGSDKVIKEGPLQVINGSKKIDSYFYLFSRFILRTNNEQSSTNKYRSLIPFSSYLDEKSDCWMIPLETCWVSNAITSASSSLFSPHKVEPKDNEFCIVTPEKTYNLEAIDANQKIEWIQKIESLLPQSDRTGRRIAKYVSSDGTTYQGSWLNSKRDGKGRLEIMKNRINQSTRAIAVYEGEFKDNEINGDGKMIFVQSQALLDGRWEKDGKGSGLIIYSNGSNCVGNWRVFLPCLPSAATSNSNVQVIEFGKVFFLDGKKYTGFLQNNMIEGYGIMSYSDGSNYVGSWKSSLRDGYGMISGGITRRESQGLDNEKYHLFRTQEKFTGRWDKGDINGEGFFEYSPSSPYINGTFKGTWGDLPLEILNGQIIRPSDSSWYMVSKKKKFKRKDASNTIETIMLSFFSSFLLLEYGSVDIGSIEDQTLNWKIVGFKLASYLAIMFEHSLHYSTEDENIYTKLVLDTLSMFQAIKSMFESQETITSDSKEKWGSLFEGVMEELFDSDRKLETVCDNESEIEGNPTENIETNKDMSLFELAKRLYLQKTRDVGVAYEQNLCRLQEIPTPFSYLGTNNVARELFLSRNGLTEREQEELLRQSNYEGSAEMVGIVWLDLERLEQLVDRILSPNAEERKLWQGKNGAPYCEAVFALRHLPQLRNPLSKLNCLLFVFHLMQNTYRRFHSKEDSTPIVLSGDEMQALAIFVTIRAGINTLCAELAMIYDWMMDHLTVGQEGYVLSLFIAAVDFINKNL